MQALSGGEVLQGERVPSPPHCWACPTRTTSERSVGQTPFFNADLICSIPIVSAEARSTLQKEKSAAKTQMTIQLAGMTKDNISAHSHGFSPFRADAMIGVA
jgi:hypothetical protein